MSYQKRGLNPLAYPALSRQISPVDLIVPPNEGPIRLAFPPIAIPPELIQPAPVKNQATLNDVINKLSSLIDAVRKQDVPDLVYSTVKVTTVVVTNNAWQQVCAGSINRIALVIGGQANTSFYLTLDPTLPISTGYTINNGISAEFYREKHSSLVNKPWYMVNNAAAISSTITVFEVIDRMFLHQL